MLLGIEIDRIEQPLAEHSLKTDYGSKGIRFDVCRAARCAAARATVL